MRRSTRRILLNLRSDLHLLEAEPERRGKFFCKSKGQNKMQGKEIRSILCATTQRKRCQVDQAVGAFDTHIDGACVTALRSGVEGALIAEDTRRIVGAFAPNSLRNNRISAAFQVRD